jgi:TonB family protein
MTRKSRLGIRIALTAGFLALALARPALAQEKAAASTLTPPNLVTFVEAPYPAAARAQPVVVELELQIAATGQVIDVTVVGPAVEGFDQAAMEAARRFVFEPARRNNQPIPARIRYRYVFEPPPPPPPTTGAIEGHVLLRGGGDVVRGAAVTLSSADGTVSRSGTTAADGSFGFTDLEPGRYHVRVAGQDLADVDQNEDVTAGDATSVVYRVAPVHAAPAGKELEFGATATVEAPPREVTKRTLGTEELLRVAGTRGDPLKAIEYMPGVGRGQMGNVIIRGSAPEDSEVQFEGAPVYRLYHFGGLTSFVHPRMLERIDLYPGNFSVRYGRKLGGIVDVGVRDPRHDGVHAMVDLNVIDSSLLVEAPLGSKGAIAFAAKRSYIDFFFDKLMPDSVGVTAAPVYWDYQLMATYHPGDNDKLRAIIYGSYDDFKLVIKTPSDDDPGLRGGLSENSGFHRAQLSWKHQYGSAVEHEVSATFGPFSFGQKVGPDLSFDVPGWDAFLRAEWRAQLHERARLMTGLDVQYLFFDGKYFGPAMTQQEGDPSLNAPLASRQNISFDRSVSLVMPAAYAELVTQATDRWQLVPGLRVDYLQPIRRWTVDPRLTTRYQVAAGTTLKGGVGLFSQVPDLSEYLPQLGNPNLQAPRGQHYGLGVEQKVGERLLLTLDGFYKRLDRMVVASPVPGQNFDNDGIGRIWGAEASARLQPSRRTTGFLSYTLSRSRRNDHGDAWRFFDFDQTHVLTVAGSLRLGAGWDLSGTFRYVSGNPMTPVVASTYNANSDLFRPTYGAVNSERSEAFHRLDMRLEKAWHGKSSSIAVYVDVQNAYNHRSQEGRTYNYNFTQSRAVPGLPVIPSLGLRGEL